MGLCDEFHDVVSCRLCLATVRIGIQLKLNEGNLCFNPGDVVHPGLLASLRRRERELQEILAPLLDESDGAADARAADDAPHDYDIWGSPFFLGIDCPCGALTEDVLPRCAVIRDGEYLGLRSESGDEAAWVGPYGLTCSTSLLASKRARANLALAVAEILRR